ncbi:MAG: hypothetical protein E7612_02160 [Ruminococcaceae bacterium]|nr:hypothetical protein [Oscillospiraceae bacterium]
MSENTNTTNLKFLHCGDIHLDSPFLDVTPEKSEERRRELRSTFMRLMEFIRDKVVDYVFISGDLFDTKYATNTTSEILIREFRSCPDTQFIIAPGRSDAYENNLIYASDRLPSNCHVFKSENLDRIYFEEDKVMVYGWGFGGEEMVHNPLYDAHVDDTANINVVCGYADLDGEVGSTTCPISKADLKRFGADYYALGSRHESTDLVDLGTSMYSYSGSLECMGFSESGIGGAKMLNVKYKDGELSMDGKNMTFGHIRFVTEEIDVTGIDTNSEIINRISRMISEKKYGMETALRCRLTGYVDPRFIIPSNLENDVFGLYCFEMLDRTLPLYGTESFKRDMTVKGELFRGLLPLLESDDEEQRTVAARAFREGLAALENRTID